VDDRFSVNLDKMITGAREKVREMSNFACMRDQGTIIGEISFCNPEVVQELR